MTIPSDYSSSDELTLVDAHQSVHGTLLLHINLDPKNRIF